MSTNFSKEFYLYENLFSDNSVASKSLTESLTKDVENLLTMSKAEIESSLTEDLVEQIIENMYEADDPIETDLTNEKNTVVFKSKGNGNYIIKSEYLNVVEKIEILTNLIYSQTEIFAGYEIFSYILSLLNIPFQYDFKEE